MTGLVIALVALIWLYNSVSIVDGREVRVIDGDSIRIPVRSLLGAKGTLECRLAGIDAPEWSQPQGPMAQRALARLVDQPRLFVLSWKRDVYGRALVRLYGSGGSLNHRMISEGFAFSTGPFGLATMLTARIAKRGMWANAPVIHPSKWRAGGQSHRPRHGRGIDLARLLDPSLPRFVRGFMPRGRR